MIKYRYKTVLFMLLAVVFTSCSDYLDVEPEDKLLEDQVYGTETGTNGVLNGIYLNLTTTNLYGGNLTMSTVDLLAQRYSSADSRYRYYNFVNYSYNQADVKANFDAIWTSAYTNILNVNDLITNVDEYNELSPAKANIVKGEAYGLRAMLHFDLLRLFGPIYSVNPEGIAIPYYTQAQASNGEFLPANEVMDLILLDLAEAETLLAEDPIRENGVNDDDLENPFYNNNRNLRLNFYAVKALQARVNLYAGYNTAANQAAKVVIEEAASIFPWTNPTDVISAGGNPDRTFSSEVIFALQNVQLYQRQTNYFSSSLQDEVIIAPNSTRLTNVFEGNENDYRFNSSWKLPIEKTYKTFYKFADVDDSDKAFRYMQPLIRMSEMYYIAAETESASANAFQYLNTVRFNRGLPNVDSFVDLNAELAKEYQKEFFGEGQLFFYYKRKNTAKILNGSSASNYSTKTMGESQYVLPLPDSEIKYQ